ncbi:CzcE family metal-binding protein [Noviherbaspirillum galbum]|uniref:CzcE family metal-binding protein n=1 Tax=Noviherbaspirillum galbum TaxID=2709383 RepID=A0A6B3SJV3_9BURK|nr:CzcE family metal-binding protein [Noviherbaspirillum galbum]NEX61033.1 CzcE family metal-binding protein [Noviherbaspirillum galbum]
MKRASIPALVAASSAIVAALGISGCAAPEPRLELLGSPANVSAAERVVVIEPQTRHVNIEGGQIVRFDVGQKSFAWHFMLGAGQRTVPLERVAPPGVLDHPVTAYVSPDLRYIGGGDKN